MLVKSAALVNPSILVAIPRIRLIPFSGFFVYLQVLIFISVLVKPRLLSLQGLFYFLCKSSTLVSGWGHA